ncbi:MAG: Crp/Fnr family transcriptional regulator [Bacillota bacterium]|nr:Crp/Fnr family transcriptional regulator [Bacillota bacterium]
MSFSEYFPSWDKLTETEKAKLSEAAVPKLINEGTVIHNGSEDCTGLFLIKSGQLRAYILSEEGKEITLYRLFEMDMCLFSASCMMNSIQFDITIEAEKDTELWVIPSGVYSSLMQSSAVLANLTNELMSTRFSEVMWLIEQILWKSFDKRLAEFLLDEANIEGSNTLKMTHEKIANHLGTAREVVTRMLRYFQGENLVKITRGTIEIIDEEGLRER